MNIISYANPIVALDIVEDPDAEIDRIEAPDFIIPEPNTNTQTFFEEQRRLGHNVFERIIRAKEIIMIKS